MKMDKLKLVQVKLGRRNFTLTKMGIFGILGLFFWYFRGILAVNSGSPEFRAGRYFFGYFFVEILGRAIPLSDVTVGKKKNS